MTSLPAVGYTYDNTVWCDLLTAYDGQSITYDQIGNPLTYRNGMCFSWQHGRQLRASLNPGNSVTTYTYNADGTRHSKTTSTNVEKTTTYYYVEGVLYAVESPDYTVVFQFDDTGRPYGFRLLFHDGSNRETIQFYKYNLQGDVVGIYDFTGNEVVTYTYDPWGKLLSATGVDVLIDANPLLYRGYVYDKETGFYYCNSRYYDPEIGRWISPEPNMYAGAFDSGSGLIGYNVYAYCANNPVCYFDFTGEWTCSIGWIFSAFLLGGCTYSISLAFDSSGNIALQTTKADVFQESSGGTFGVASIGVARFYSFTSLDSIDDLNDQSLNTGGSIPVYGPISVGGEVISSPSDPVDIDGCTVSVGVGAGVDIHTSASLTETQAEFNIVDVVKNIWSTVRGWFGGGK